MWLMWLHREMYRFDETVVEKAAEKKKEKAVVRGEKRWRAKKKSFWHFFYFVYLLFFLEWMGEYRRKPENEEKNDAEIGRVIELES